MEDKIKSIEEKLDFIIEIFKVNPDYFNYNGNTYRHSAVLCIHECREVYAKRALFDIEFLNGLRLSVWADSLDEVESIRNNFIKTGVLIYK